MRVIAGTARGRRIEALPGTAVRPTSDRVREAMFNRLDSLGLVRGATVLDLFAGSGALGIEALSRGAAEVTFVEQDAAAARVVTSNLEVLGLVAEVRRMPALRFLETTTATFDLALLDPPYGYEEWSELLAVLPAAAIVIESEDPVELPPGWVELRSSRYGRTHVMVAEAE